MEGADSYIVSLRIWIMSLKSLQVHYGYWLAIDLEVLWETMRGQSVRPRFFAIHRNQRLS